MKRFFVNWFLVSLWVVSAAVVLYANRDGWHIDIFTPVCATLLAVLVGVLGIYKNNFRSTLIQVIAWIYLGYFLWLFLIAGRIIVPENIDGCVYSIPFFAAVFTIALRLLPMSLGDGSDPRNPRNPRKA
jgi:hypothetical protein